MATSSATGAAVVGLRMGRAHCQAYAGIDGVALRAVCDVSEEKAREVAEQFAVPLATTEFGDILGKIRLEDRL